MVHIMCSCGTVFRRKEGTRSNLLGIFSRGPHKGHAEVARWTFNPPEWLKMEATQ